MHTERVSAMVDPVPVTQQPEPASPGSDPVNSVPEVKEDTPKDEKWSFSEPQAIREDQVRNAVNFLSHPKVQGTPIVQRFSFLERKGLTREEIDEAFRRCPDPTTSDATKTIVPSEGKLVTGPQTQALSHNMHQEIALPPQSAKHDVSGPSSAIIPARSGSQWSQLILGAGLIAAAGAGTGYLFQKILVPKLRAWLRDMVLDEKKATEAKSDMQSKSIKLSSLEEAAGAAAAAANAAAAATAEVANVSREVLKLQAEERLYLRSLMKSLDSKAEDLKSTLTIMSKNVQNAEGLLVSEHAEEPSGANYYEGSAKPYQRTTTPLEQVPMKQDVKMSKSMALGNGVDDSQSNGYSATTDNYVSLSEEEPWWRHKKVEVETIMSPKQHVEGTVSELEAGLDQEIGSARPRTYEFSAKSRGGPLGRQGWTPPPVPQTVMPGAASAIRYQKIAMANQGKVVNISEEKAMDSQASFETQVQPLPQTVMPGSAPAIKLHNSVTIEEIRPIAAEEKEMDAQTLVEQGKISEGVEITEIVSVDKEIPLSLTHEVDEIHTDGL